MSEDEEDGFLPQSSNNSNITQLEFIGVLPISISPHYSYLEECTLKDCDYEYIDIEGDHSFTTSIELPSTAIGILSLLEYTNSFVEHGLYGAVDYMKSLILISIISNDQEFTRSYMCTTCSNGSFVERISNDMVGALKNTFHEDRTSFITIEVKCMKKLVLKIYDDSNGEVYFDISIPFPE